MHLSVHSVQMFNSMETCEITTNIAEQEQKNTISHYMSSISTDHIYTWGKIEY